MNLQNKIYIPGILLILAGILLFIIQWGGWLEKLSWPFYLLLPGFFIALFSLFLDENNGEGFMIFGFLLFTIGGILYFQNITGYWSTWAYMWALIPTSVGLGQLLHASLFKNKSKSRESFEIIRTGLMLFVIFAGVFEFLIFHRNTFFKSFGLAVLCILVGLLILLQSMKKRQTPTNNHEEETKTEI